MTEYIRLPRGSEGDKTGHFEYLKKCNRYWANEQASCAGSSKEFCFTYNLGILGYQDALEIQYRLVDIVVHRAFNVLLLVQHHACLTIGRFRGSEDIIAPEVVLAREGISIFYTDRGGGLTYHGPGQLVVYPILSLNQNGIGIRHYIWKLEEVVIKMLANWDISGQRIRKHPGVWISDEKICSIGLRVTQGVTMHGFSINVCPNLQHFELIRPCGIIDKKMTSMCKLLGYEVKVEDIIESLLWTFSQVFGFRLEAEDRIKRSNLEAGH